MYYLIDYENVFEYGLDSIEVLTNEDRLVIFYSALNSRIHSYKLNGILKTGCQVELVQLQQPRSNALDFYIAVKVGQIIAEDSKAKICIISKDNGFKSIYDYVSTYVNSASIQTAASISQCMSGVETVSLESIFKLSGDESNNSSESLPGGQTEPLISQPEREKLWYSIAKIIHANNGVVCVGKLCSTLRKTPSFASILDGQKHKMEYLRFLYDDRIEITFENGSDCLRFRKKYNKKIEDIGLSKPQVASLKQKGIRFLIDALMFSESELVKLNHIGKITAKKIHSLW
jgi:hypothetical protein